MPIRISDGPMRGWHGCPKRDELIFDARTCELIGQYQKTAKGTPPAAASPSGARLQIAVASRPGQLP